MNGVSYCRPMKREDTKSAENPCRSGGQNDPEDSKKPRASPVDVRSSLTNSTSFQANLPMSELITRCHEAELKATKYAQLLEVRIKSQDMIKSLHKTHVHAFSFLGTENTTNTTANMNQTQILELDFRHFGKVLVFLNQIIKDDKQQDIGVPKDDLIELQRRITRVYCLLQSIGNFVLSVTTQIMSEEERNMSSIAQLIYRNYVFVTDLVELLKIKEQNYYRFQMTLAS